MAQKMGSQHPSPKFVNVSEISRTPVRGFRKGGVAHIGRKLHATFVQDCRHFDAYITRKVCKVVVSQQVRRRPTGKGPVWNLSDSDGCSWQGTLAPTSAQPTELSLRLLGPFTRSCLDGCMTRQLARLHSANYPCSAPLFCADFVSFLLDFCCLSLSEIAVPSQNA